MSLKAEAKLAAYEAPLEEEEEEGEEDVPGGPGYAGEEAGDGAGPSVASPEPMQS